MQQVFFEMLNLIWKQVYPCHVHILIVYQLSESCFISHLHRKHMVKGTSTISASNLLQIADNSEFVDPYHLLSSNLKGTIVTCYIISSDKEFPSVIDCNQDLKKMGFAWLKVEYFIPLTTIQVIINEQQEMKIFDLNYVKDQLKRHCLCVIYLSIRNKRI